MSEEHTTLEEGLKLEDELYKARVASRKKRRQLEEEIYLRERVEDAMDALEFMTRDELLATKREIDKLLAEMQEQE